MQAFADVVRQGKALYIGVSEWTAELTAPATRSPATSASSWCRTNRSTRRCGASSRQR